MDGRGTGRHRAPVRAGHRWKSRKCGVFWLTGLLAAATTSWTTPARAYNLTGYKQASFPVDWVINTSSFQNNLTGLSLTPSQSEFWVAFASEMWMQRTGTLVEYQYAGSTTHTLPADCNEGSFDGNNDIYVYPGCDPVGGCSGLVAVHQPYANLSNGTYVENDICIYGNARTWRVQTGPYPAGSRDLVSTLVHELGHSLGLDHTPNTVMDSGGDSDEETLRRYPYGDDIKGIRSLYAVLPLNRVWKSMAANGSSWATGQTLGGSEFYTHAAIGKRNSSNYSVVSTKLSNNGTKIQFTVANAPLSTSSSWSNATVNMSSWRPIAVAGKPTGSSLYVAAWTKARDDLGCPGVIVARSTDNFATLSTKSFATICTIHEPALAFDPTSGRFIMIYVRRDWSATRNALNDRIYVRTSTDGSSWTSAQDLGIYTTDAVDVACTSNSPTGCMMTYGRSNTNVPELLTRRFTVSSTGKVTLSSWTSAGTAIYSAPAAGVLTNGGNRWFLGVNVPTSPFWWSQSLWTASGSSNPFAFPGSQLQVAVTVQRPTFAMSSAFSTGYLFYVN